MSGRFHYRLKVTESKSRFGRELVDEFPDRPTEVLQQSVLDLIESRVGAVDLVQISVYVTYQVPKVQE